MFFFVFNCPVLCRPLMLVYQRVNINGYLHVQGLNRSNARGDGTITSLERVQKSINANVICEVAHG